MDPIATLFAKADELKADLEELQEERTANREALRTMDRAGALTDEQRTRLTEMYPPRKKRENNGDSDAA